jgi:tetratricopeptide (TPR) repeat protein
VRHRTLAIGLVLLVGCSCAAWGQAQKTDISKRPPAVFEDKPEVIPPAAPSEAEEDRREAQALYAAARKKQGRGEIVDALRLYQRANRRDPGRGAILLEIVKLADELKRPTLLDNYGPAAAEANPGNRILQLRVADHLRSRGRAEESAALFEKFAALERAAEKKTPQHVELALIRGVLSFDAGNYAGAAERFAEVLHAVENPKEYGLSEAQRDKLLEKPFQKYVIFGDAFLRAGRLKEAQEAFETAYRINRDRPGEAFQMARVHSAAGRLDEALKQVQVYLDAEVENHALGPYQLLAEIYEKQKKSDALLPDLEKRLAAAKAAGRENVYLTLFLAEQYRKAKRMDKAEPLFEHVAEFAEGKPNYAAPLAASQMALVKMYREAKNADKLLKVLGWAASISGNLGLLGDEVEAVRKDKALTGAILKAAEASKAKLDYGGHLAAALLAMENKDYKLGSEFFAAAIEAKPDAAAEASLTWGVALLQGEQSAEAVKVLQRGVDDELLPAERPEFHYWLAMALEMAGKTEEALKAARHAVSKAPADPRMHARVAWVLYHAKRYDEAKSVYTTLIKKFNRDEPTQPLSQSLAQVRQARLILSNIAVFQNNLPAAEEWLEQVLDEDPQDVQANNDLGYLWADQGKHLQRALHMIRHALAAEPKNGAYLDSLGWVMYRLGRYDAAVAELQKAVEVEEKPDGTILDHLADAYVKINQIDKAREAWQRALKNFDKDRDADKIKATQEKLEKLK